MDRPAWSDPHPQRNTPAARRLAPQVSPPDVSEVASRAGFVARLCALKEWAEVSYPQIARRSGLAGHRISHGTAHHLASGKGVPQEESLIGFLHGCGLPRDQMDAWLDA